MPAGTKKVAKKSTSPLVEKELQFQDAEGFNMKANEADQYAAILKKIVYARNQRELPRDEFDGMSYENAYLSNRRAAMSFLVPKKNDDEVRINTGTTEKRIEMVLNEILSLNLEEEIETYDKDDNLLQDVSDVFTDVVKRTEQMEMARDKDIYIFQELLTQPSVFVEELWVEEPTRRDSGKKTFRKRMRCDRRLLSGVQVYLGDVNLPDTRFNEQPYIVKYARMDYDEATRLLKNLNPERWNYVKPGSYVTFGAPNLNLYRKGSLLGNEVEVFTYMSYTDNEIQVVANGIPLLEVGHEYTDVYGDLGGYHITMVSLKPYVTDFAYGKPLTQSAKTLQALDNETIRNLIRKMRQALEPPVGTPKGKVFSRDIWNPGAMVQGVKKDDFQKLIEHQGVTRSDMTMFDLIEKKVNEFIGTMQQEPLQGKTQVTATELMMAQKNAMKMLGLSVLAAMRLKERLAMLRVKNVWNNYTKPVGQEEDPVTKKIQDVYARFTIDNSTVNGQAGKRIIQFSDRNLDESETEMLFNHEQMMKKMGKNVEYKVVNAKKLRDLDLYFYSNVVAKPRESSEMEKMMNQDKLKQAVAITQITGRPINANKVVEGFERAWREKDFFEKEAPRVPMSPMDQGMGMQGNMQMPGSGVGDKLKEMISGGMGGAVPKVGEMM